MNQLVQEEVREGGRIESDENCWQCGRVKFFFSLRHYKKIIHRAKSSTKHLFCFRALAPPSPFFPFRSSRPTRHHHQQHTFQHMQKTGKTKRNRGPISSSAVLPTRKQWQVRIGRSAEWRRSRRPNVDIRWGKKPESPSNSYW